MAIYFPHCHREKAGKKCLLPAHPQALNARPRPSATVLLRETKLLLVTKLLRETVVTALLRETVVTALLRGTKLLLVTAIK